MSDRVFAQFSKGVFAASSSTLLQDEGDSTSSKEEKEFITF